MIIYKGSRTHGQISGPLLVTRNGEPLSPDPSRAFWDHASGFNWGYGGSGPAQLALALLIDATGDNGLSARLHQQFKWDFVGTWGDDWEITDEEILSWVKVEQKK